MNKLILLSFLLFPTISYAGNDIDDFKDIYGYHINVDKIDYFSVGAYQQHRIILVLGINGHELSINAGNTGVDRFQSDRKKVEKMIQRCLFDDDIRVINNELVK